MSAAKRAKLMMAVEGIAASSASTTASSASSRRRPVKYWIGTVSKSHVRRGVEGGFAQLCHGKSAGLGRMKMGDYLIYYSPKQDMEGNEAVQKFTAVGRIKNDEAPYPFEMFPGFVPYRKDVDYFKDVKEVAIKPLVERLSFVKNKKSWGMAFRYGLIEIPMHDFQIIAREMGVPEDVE